MHLVSYALDLKALSLLRILELNNWLTCFFMMFLSQWWEINSFYPWILAKANLLILELLQSEAYWCHSML